MGKRILTGSFVALITPFKDDGTPDIEGFGKLIEFQALNGTSAVLIMGSTRRPWPGPVRSPRS
jgi:4-hydroxy-tetrahydrodipicolinate synthase